MISELYFNIQVFKLFNYICGNFIGSTSPENKLLRYFSILLALHSFVPFDI